MTELEDKKVELQMLLHGLFNRFHEETGYYVESVQNLLIDVTSIGSSQEEKVIGNMYIEVIK